MPIITIENLISNNFRLAPSNYKELDMNLSKFEEISRYILKVEKGSEVGSQEYVENSDYTFLRTSAFDQKEYSTKLDNNSLLSITPRSFVNKDLKEGDILICKDSNVGEVAMLDKDMNKTMFSAGINKIFFKEHPKYFFALMKNNNFKNQLYNMIPKGSTIKHAKDLYLKCKIPILKNQEVIKYIEELVDIIIHKEKEIKHKKNIIDVYISDEIESNQKNESFLYAYPKVEEIQQIKRLDTGNYTKDFKEIEFKIKNYKDGFFYIEQKKIKGGNTPKDRYIENKKDLKYLWIIPTFINDEGTINDETRIDCLKNNINENCCLITNRTSKGGFGEYVGIASFYNYVEKGKAQHNQGIYKVFNYSDEKLIFITCLLNSVMYRKICANLSMGSKMKELKVNNFLQIPFPNFPEEKIRFIYQLYSAKGNKKETSKCGFLEDNFKYDDESGILEIFESMNHAKSELNSLINELYSGNNIKLKYEIF